MSMTPRFLPRYFLALLLAFLLVGCGFQMRGNVQLPPMMAKTQISGGYTKELYQELERHFRAASASLIRQKGSEAGMTTLTIHKDHMDRRVFSIGSRTGKAAEYELYYVVAFEVTDAKGNIIMPRQQLNATQEYLYENPSNTANVIGTQRQEDLLREDLRRSIVQQMMRLIQAQAQ